jgi:nucleoredoxin
MLSKTNDPIVFPGSEVTLLYFSASWCGPCKVFTPQLAAFYRALRDEGVPESACEIVFVSSDRSLSEFKNYYEPMPWGRLSYEERDEKNRLASLFDVTSIPAVVALDRHGKRINCAPRLEIAKWATGEWVNSSASQLLAKWKKDL